MNLASTLRHLDFSHIWEPLLWPMTVGGLVLGSLAGLTVYLLTRWGAVMFRAERRKRLAERAKRRAEATMAAQPGTA